MNNDIEVKKSQLLKVSDIDNARDIVEIPRILNEERARKRLEREGLGENNIVERPRRERRPNPRYL